MKSILFILPFAFQECLIFLIIIGCGSRACHAHVWRSEVNFGELVSPSTSLILGLSCFCHSDCFRLTVSFQGAWTSDVGPCRWLLGIEVLRIDPKVLYMLSWCFTTEPCPQSHQATPLVPKAMPLVPCWWTQACVLLLDHTFSTPHLCCLYCFRINYILLSSYNYSFFPPWVYMCAGVMCIHVSMLEVDTSCLLTRAISSCKAPPF